jgi:hypothetical protein
LNRAKTNNQLRRSREDRNESNNSCTAQSKVKDVKTQSKTLRASSGMLSSRSNKSGTAPINSHMETVQKRKDEIFRKRQIELREKLCVKEQRRQTLSQNKWNHTPKYGDKNQVFKTHVQNPEFDTGEKQVKPRWE